MYQCLGKVFCAKFEIPHKISCPYIKWEKFWNIEIVRAPKHFSNAPQNSWGEQLVEDSIEMLDLSQITKYPWGKQTFR